VYVYSLKSLSGSYTRSSPVLHSSIMVMPTNEHLLIITRFDFIWFFVNDLYHVVKQCNTHCKTEVLLFLTKQNCFRYN